MTDLFIAGTGNSRYLKSVSNFLTLYPTYEEFVDALVAGTLPVDFNGLNVDGVTTVGTAGSKANILPDATATLLGLDSGDDPKIKDAFNALAVLSGASAPTTGTVGVVRQFYLETTTPQLYQCTAASGGVYTWVKVGGSQFETGSYVGAGVYGSSNAKSVTFSSPVKEFSIIGAYPAGNVIYYYSYYTLPAIIVDALTTSYRQLNIQRPGESTPNSTLYMKRSADSKTIYWYDTENANNHLNASGVTYVYMGKS